MTPVPDSTDHGLVILEVHDDGKGFDRNQIQIGSGLRNMRARAAEFNAEVTVEPSRGGGTTVRFALPYAVADADSFRRKALRTGFALVIFALLSIANPRGGSSLAILMIPLFDFVRYRSRGDPAPMRSRYHVPPARSGLDVCTASGSRNI